MGRPPRELTPSESALHFFGAELRHWRTLRKLSQNGLGRRSHDSSSLISKIEKAERFPTRDLARRLDETLATGGVLERLWPRVEQERAQRATTAYTPADAAEFLAADLGLVWCADTAATVEVVGTLWRADMERRAVLLSAAWVAAACAEPLREWLLNRQDEVLQERASRQVGHSDIDALWTMCESFTDLDLRLGGGYARSTLIHYVNEVVLPLLHGSYREKIGQELMAATGRLCDICAYMCFDSGRHGLAQRYFIQALRLAQAGGSRELGAHILADMSQQAHYLGNAPQALELAEAGYRAALDCDALATAARCAATQGEAHALRGDERATATACTTAENLLDRAAPPGERTWLKPFTADQLLAQRLYMARDLGRAQDVQRIAPTMIAFSGGRARRRVVCVTAMAASYLPVQGTPHNDLDRACELLGQELPSLSSLHSAVTLQRFNTVRRVLAEHADRPCVQEFEDHYRATVTTADPQF